jgi:hypothetical protein
MLCIISRTSIVTGFISRFRNISEKHNGILITTEQKKEIERKTGK